MSQSSFSIPEPPVKFNWRELRAWLNQLREIVATERGIAGTNMDIKDSLGGGQVYNAQCPK